MVQWEQLWKDRLGCCKIGSVITILVIKNLAKLRVQPPDIVKRRNDRTIKTHGVFGTIIASE